MIKPMRAVPVLLALALAGCGGAAKLTDVEDLDVHEAEVAFANVIVDGSMYRQSLDGIDRIIEIYRAKPDAMYSNDPDDPDDDLTMRQVLEDAASDLDRYQPDMAAELDRALGE